LESQADRIGFNYAVDYIIIVPSFTLKYINEIFRMKYDQRVIIRFLYNEGADADNIAQILQAQLFKMAIHFK
jgi:hypothetical protein